jgi:hypothetical protein
MSERLTDDLGSYVVWWILNRVMLPVPLRPSRGGAAVPEAVGILGPLFPRSRAVGSWLSSRPVPMSSPGRVPGLR